MRISITTDDGILLDRIEDLEARNLYKPTACYDLMNDIRDSLIRAARRHDIPDEEFPHWLEEED